MEVVEVREGGGNKGVIEGPEIEGPLDGRIL